MHLLARLLNRKPATERLERWIKPRANRSPALPPEAVLELDLRQPNPKVRSSEHAA